MSTLILCIPDKSFFRPPVAVGSVCSAGRPTACRPRKFLRKWEWADASAACRLVKNPFNERSRAGKVRGPRARVRALMNGKKVH